MLDSKWGLNQGFDTYHDKFDVSKYKSTSLGDVARRANEVVDNAMPWLEQHADRQFFAWLHFYDAHTPYDPPEPFKSRFRSNPYAGEIAFVDEQIGRVLQWLDARGLAERTIVVAIGDHGESLNEHREGHARPLHLRRHHAGPLHRPGAIRDDEGTAGEERGSIRGRDAHDPGPARDAGSRRMEGRSLVPLMTGAATDLELAAYSESLYAFNHYGWSDVKALRSGRFKFIASDAAGAVRSRAGSGRVDQSVRGATLAGRADGRRSSLRSRRRRPRPPRHRQTVDPETRERLAALGYIGSFNATPRRPGELLPDAKDKIDVFNLMNAAREGSGKDAIDAAIARLRKVLEMDPNILDAWVMLGNEYFRKRDFHDRTRRSTSVRSSIRPDYELATINLAAAYRALGNYRGGGARLRAVPGQGSEECLGPLSARRVVRRARSTGSRRAGVPAVARRRHTCRVSAKRARRHRDEERATCAKPRRRSAAAIAQKPDVKLAHFNLALIAEARGDVVTAAREYQVEIDTQPNAFKSAFNLGKLHEQRGNAAAQEAAFRKSIELNPDFAEGYFYLAKFYLDQGRNLDEAKRLAEAGPGDRRRRAITPRSGTTCWRIFTAAADCTPTPNEKRQRDGPSRPRRDAAPPSHQLISELK